MEKKSSSKPQWNQMAKPKHPAYTLIERISHMRVGIEEIIHFLSTNRSAMLNQGNSATQGKYGQSAALFSMGVIRRNCAGLGSKKQSHSQTKLGPGRQLV